MPAILHCFGESGNSYKAALAMNLSGFEWQSKFVDFFNGETRSDQFRKLNPMGEAPVLEHNSLVISQSGAIQDYVVEMTARLGGDTPQERRETLRWVLWDNHKMSSICGTARFLSNFLPKNKRPQEVIRWHMGRLKAALAVLESELREKQWLVGNGPTIADISCCGYLYYPEPFGFTRRDWPNIDSWLTRISQLEGWKHPYELMPRNKVSQT